MTQWGYLFQCTGLVTDLLDECLVGGSLDTAILYLLVLQNLHPLPVSRQYTVRLLEAAVKEHRWDLAVDLERFLQVISQEHETYSRQLSKKLSNTSDLAGRLRRSSESYDLDDQDTTPTPTAVTPVTPKPGPIDVQQMFSDRQCADQVVTPHAHHLLLTCQFSALGEMSFHLLSFSLADYLMKEHKNLPEITDPSHVFMCIHEDFSWPYPDKLPAILSHPKVCDQITTASDGSDSRWGDGGGGGGDTESVCSSFYSECRVSISPEQLSEALKRGSEENERKLTFFLDHFKTAKVTSYGLLFALALRDVTSIVELVKMDISLLSILMAVNSWSEQESPGYSLFLQTLKPLLSPLFPIQQQSELMPLVRVSSRSSINSVSSNDRTLERAIEGLSVRPADRLN
eukprot:sb/3465371/